MIEKFAPRLAMLAALGLLFPPLVLDARAGDDAAHAIAEQFSGAAAANEKSQPAKWLDSEKARALTASMRDAEARRKAADTEQERLAAASANAASAVRTSGWSATVTSESAAIETSSILPPASETSGATATPTSPKKKRSGPDKRRASSDAHDPQAGGWTTTFPPLK